MDEAISPLPGPGVKEKSSWGWIFLDFFAIRVQDSRQERIMKRISFCLLVPLALASLPLLGAETAQLRLYCVSVAVHEGTNQYGDTVTLNSMGGLPSGADELYPSRVPGEEITLPGTEYYASGMWIYDSTLLYASSGSIFLTVPADSDVNSNRFPDFFEVALGVTNQVTTGSYVYTDATDFNEYDGSINTTWYRPAGSKSGYCIMTFNDSVLGAYWGTFISTFDILEYTGALSYIPGTNVVTGTVTLSQTSSNNTFQGAIEFDKTDTNHFNALVIQPGIWNAMIGGNQQSLNFTNHYFYRDPNYPTNYAGYVEFDDDGTQNSAYPYAVWVLSITDTNDANLNGIPDFSDDPQNAISLPRPPQLSLAIGANNLMLTIHGDVGHVHQVQEATALMPAIWQTVQSVTLTNDPQVVPVPVPSVPATFLRVVAQ